MEHVTQNDTAWVHRAAGLAAWQDERTPAQVNYIRILGVLPHGEGEEPMYIVRVEGTADSGHGYTYPIEATLTITRREDGTPVIDDASDEQIALAREEK